MMMKFTCNTGELNQGINSALLAVSPKSTLLALEGILVRVTTKEITLMSYNLEMGITAIVDAKVEKPARSSFPPRSFRISSAASKVMRSPSKQMTGVWCRSPAVFPSSPSWA